MEKIEWPDKMGDCSQCAETGMGKKYDQGKPRWELVPFGAMDEVVRVLGHGAEKYGDYNWTEVGTLRYLGALGRHLSAYAQGHKKDKESGLHPLAHVVCCCLFILAKELDTEGMAGLPNTHPDGGEEAAQTGSGNKSRVSPVNDEGGPRVMAAPLGSGFEEEFTLFKQQLDRIPQLWGIRWLT